jgi:hypothetical protein
MKKIITRYMVMALGILSFAACHEDEGNYDYHELVDFYVAQQDIPLDITIAQFHTLNLPSRLVYGGDKNDLEYTWVASMVMSKKDTLATTENLSAPVPLTPGTYTLAFTATARESKRSTLQLYNLTVEGSIGTGLLVLHEKNGVADCDLIKTRSLVGSLARDTVLRGLYSQANPGYPLAGKPLQVAMTAQSYIYLGTDAGGVRLSTEDMSIMAHFEDMFFDTPEVAKPQGFNLTAGGLLDVLINDGKYYFMSYWDVVLGREKDDLFVFVPGDYYAAPYVYQGSILISSPTFYDQAGMRFCTYSTEAIPILSLLSGAFSFGNVGKKMVYMETGFGNGINLAIFKNPVEDGNRYLYVMNLSAFSPSTYVANAAYDISAWPDVANARFFTFSTRGPVGFYATSDHVYRYTYDPNNFTAQPTAEEAWPYIPANETITALQLVNHAGISVPSSALDKYLLIATHDEASGEGKVYMIETDVVNGTCTATPVAVYTGFGKVASMIFKPV